MPLELQQFPSGLELEGDAPSLVDVPTLPKSQIAALDCTSLKDCLMVGGTNGETLAERYDGRRVTVVPTANPPGTTFNALNAIACRYGRIPTKLLTRCAAIGTGGTASPPYLETWDSKTRIFRLGAQLSLR